MKTDDEIRAESVHTDNKHLSAHYEHLLAELPETTTEHHAERAETWAKDKTWKQS